MNDLLLLSGNDIPFPEARVTIHQPTLKEIAYIGEESFFIGFEMFKFTKNILSEEDKLLSKDKSNFDIIIAILGERKAVMQKNSICAKMLLALLFPEYNISLTEDAIVLIKDDETFLINSSNFDIFQEILLNMFSYDKKEESKSTIKPSGEMASKIAEKLRKRQEKLGQLKNAGDGSQKVDILSRYASIISIALAIDLNAVLKYTVYQIYDTIRRYHLKESFNIYMQAKMAGASELKEPEEWMKDIH